MQLQEELTKIQKSMGPKLQKLQIYNELPAVHRTLKTLFPNILNRM